MTKTLFSVQIGCSPIMSESYSQSEGEIHVLPVYTQGMQTYHCIVINVYPAQVLFEKSNCIDWIFIYIYMLCTCYYFVQVITCTKYLYKL